MFRAAMDWAGPRAFIAGIVLSLSGCSSFGTGKQLQQLEHENSRLLSEFRAERQRRESAERTAQQLEARLAESEKMLARQLQGPPGAGRLSSLTLPPTSGSVDFSLPASSPTSSLPSLGATSGSGSIGSGDLRWQRRN